MERKMKALVNFSTQIYTIIIQTADIIKLSYEVKLHQFGDAKLIIIQELQIAFQLYNIEDSLKLRRFSKMKK